MAWSSTAIIQSPGSDDEALASGPCAKSSAAKAPSPTSSTRQVANQPGTRVLHPGGHAMTVGDGGMLWKGTGWYVQPKSARDVMRLLGGIGVYSTGQRFAWRGMSSVDFRLQSSLHRHLGISASESDVRAAEVDLLARAREWGLGVTETGHVDDLQLLADLQHYEIPTRLIDFTSNPMTALWFACQKAPESIEIEGGERRVARSGVLLALNITKWPRHTSVGDPHRGVTWDYLGDPRGATLKRALGLGVPFVVEQSIPNARLRAQEGLFIASAVPERMSLGRFLQPFVSLSIASSKGDPISLAARLTEERGRGNPLLVPFVAVIISAGLKPRLLSYMENSYNRRPGALFPDYQGFARYGVPPLSKVPHRAGSVSAAEQPSADTSLDMAT